MWKSLLLAKLGTTKATVIAERMPLCLFKMCVLVDIFFYQVCNLSTLCFSYYFFLSIVTGMLPCMLPCLSSNCPKGPNKYVLVNDIKFTADLLTSFGLNNVHTSTMRSGLMAME